MRLYKGATRTRLSSSSRATEGEWRRGQLKGKRGCQDGMVNLLFLSTGTETRQARATGGTPGNDPTEAENRVSARDTQPY